MWKKNSLFKFLSSLKLAVVSILTLAAVLTYGTIVESYYGMRGAHVLVYGSAWFGGVLFLLGLNVLCAALSRFPWKRHQTGFVITHSGILVILFGSVLTQRFGVDGNLPVQEGQQDNEAILNDLRLLVQDEATNEIRQFPVRDAATAREGRLVEIALSKEQSLVVKKILPRVTLERVVKPSQMSGVGSPALHFELFNSRFRVDEWVLVRHPTKPAEVNLGPAVVSFKKFWTAEEEVNFLKGETPKAKKESKAGYVLMQHQGKQYRLSVDEHLKAWRRVSGTSLELKVDRYLPYAVVQGNDLASKSNEPKNPAVQLLVRSAGGAEEKHTIFAFFPEFATLHRTGSKEPKEKIGAKFTLVPASNGEGMGMDEERRGELQFAQSHDGKKIFYRALGSGGVVNAKGEVEIGKPVATGWMDLQFQVSEWHPAGVEESEPRYVEYISGESNFLSSIYVEQEGGRAPASATGIWLVEGETQSISAGARRLSLTFQKERIRLPFNLFLDKFTVGTDPGTQKAATYESKVTVRDPKAGVPTTAVVSMNEPLDYGGYTFYQASYQMTEGRPPVSVFAVNYDPGRIVKYLGSIIIVLGILLMFYMNPHYWNVLLGGRKGKPA